MRNVAIAAGLLGTVAMALPALANDSVSTILKDPKQWGIQTGDYANTRYSKLDQITAKNVDKLQVAWTFSTGVLRATKAARS